MSKDANRNIPTTRDAEMVDEVVVDRLVNKVVAKGVVDVKNVMG